MLIRFKKVLFERQRGREERTEKGREKGRDRIFYSVATMMRYDPKLHPGLVAVAVSLVGN